MDVRHLTAATHQDLRQLIESKVFRSDLISARLCSAARERAKKSPPSLAICYMDRIGWCAHKQSFLTARYSDLSYYSPGNIRELRKYWNALS